jgi:hypothetical protein
LKAPRLNIGSWETVFFGNIHSCALWERYFGLGLGLRWGLPSGSMRPLVKSLISLFHGRQRSILSI